MLKSMASATYNN